MLGKFFRGSTVDKQRANKKQNFLTCVNKKRNVEINILTQVEAKGIT
jgi:hypothetical protein